MSWPLYRNRIVWATGFRGDAKRLLAHCLSKWQHCVWCWTHKDARCCLHLLRSLSKSIEAYKQRHAVSWDMEQSCQQSATMGVLVWVWQRSWCSLSQTSVRNANTSNKLRIWRRSRRSETSSAECTAGVGVPCGEAGPWQRGMVESTRDGKSVLRSGERPWFQSRVKWGQQ